ncbi:ImpA family type VI secretion system protein [Scandinavium goeteborgense]|uniref:type VI secretion system protein TssA n=1 Tax=Scandinavium goeteborgense TaxID=1851514 RepID=UPI0037FE3545
MLPTYYLSLFEAISNEKPCGVSLEYDPAFILLLSKLQPKLDAEYGNFVEAAEPISWGEIERECLVLLQKSKDIRLIITLIRCRLRQYGPQALAEGLSALHALLLQFPDDLYPQLMDEGEFEPLMRANAFSELEASDGLMADLRNQTLPAAAGLQINIKDYEKAHSVPREEGAIAQTSLEALRHEWEKSGDITLASLRQASDLLQQIRCLLEDSLGYDAPGFTRLTSLLSLFSAVQDFNPSPEPIYNSPADFTVFRDVQDGVREEVLTASEAESIAAAPPKERDILKKRDGIETRSDALSRLTEIRSWFEKTEPSSPVALLLAFTEKTVGLNFSALLKILPADMIALISMEKE